MGISRTAFEVSKGFGNIHPGEDPDLSIRLKKLEYKTILIPEAFVYHKRRVSWNNFYKQVYKFGLVRPILNVWHPETKKITYWFPTLFCLLFLVAIGLMMIDFKWGILFYILYFVIAFFVALVSSNNIVVSALSLVAIIIQFFGYGYGFLKSTILVGILNKNPEKQFPELFFNS